MRVRILLIVLVVAMVLTACSGSGTKPTSDSSGRPSSQATASPSDEPLIVYTLYQNKIMDRIIKLAYGKGVQVVIGTQESISEDDAIRSLSTELLAGGGPDILIMDGLPIQSYAEKGALADLRDSVPEQVFAGVRAAYAQEDGSIYAMPVKLMLPTIQGEDIDNIQSLTDIADRLEQNETGYIYLDIYSIYAVYGHRWLQDGQFQEGAFREDLVAMERLQRHMSSLELSILYDYEFIDRLPGSGAAVWHLLENDILSFRYQGTIRYLGEVFDVMRFHENASLKPLGDGVFIPRCILSVNSQSKQMDRAQSFVWNCLFSDLQRIDAGDDITNVSEVYGFPVNEDVFRVQIGDQPDPPLIRSEGNPKDLGEDTEWLEPWYDRTPTYEEAFNVFEMVKACSAPAPTDHALRDIFLEQITNYLNKTSSIEDVLIALNKKLSLYLAE